MDIFLITFLSIVSIGYLFFNSKLKGYQTIPVTLLIITFTSEFLFRGNFPTYLAPLILIPILVGYFISINKMPNGWLYFLPMPIVPIYMWYNYRQYAGVISPQIILAFMIITYLISPTLIRIIKIFACKIIFHGALIACIILICFISLPTYTVNSAWEKLESDIGKRNVLILESVSTLRAVPKYTIFVDHCYVFTTRNNGIVTIYGFNPITGYWSEWYVTEEQQ